MSCTITVTGATGNVGSVLSNILLERGHGVRAVGRSADRLKALTDKGAEARVGDLADTAFLTDAYRGADAAFVMIPPDMTSDDFLGYSANVSKSHVKAIRESGVNNVVAMSSIGAELESGSGVVMSLHQLEQDLAALDGVNVHVLRPAYFMDNVWVQMDVIKNLGMMAGTIKPDVKQPVVHTSDIGVMAAERLDKRDFEGHTMEYVLGPRDISYNEITSAIADALGKPDLSYMYAAGGDAKIAMKQLGISANFADLLLELSDAINTGIVLKAHKRTDANTTPTTIEEFAQWFAQAYNS